MGDARKDRAPLYIRQRRKWYGLARWKKLRAMVLASNPRCAICGIARATQCDHIVHSKDNARFWDITNLRPACALCNNRLGAKARHADVTPPAPVWGGGSKHKGATISTALHTTKRDTLVSRVHLFSNLMARARGDA